LLVFGFPESRIDGGQLVVTPTQCTTRVRQVALQSEGRSRPSSYLELDGEIGHGMSGGPCLDAQWNAVGVNARGWDSFPIAYVAVLWPAMAVQINLFQTGAFPALELFTTGAAQALGYRRVQISSTGSIRLGRTDPAALVAHPPPGLPAHLRGAIEFARANAQQALGTVRALLAKSTEDGEPLDNSGLHRALREYFWELDATVRTALTWATRRLSLPNEAATDWDHFLRLYRERAGNPETLDAVAALEFSWHGEDLFEIRTYADWCRSGSVSLEARVRRNDNAVLAVCLNSCRAGGQQVFLPDGLDRYIISAKRFVSTLLRLVPEP
jgi:hypothetical protein